MKKIYIFIYIFIVFGLILLLTGIIMQNTDKIYYLSVRKEFQKIKKKNITKEEEIKKIIYKAKLTSQIYQKDILKEINEYELYATTENLLNSYLKDNILKSDTTEQDIKKIKKYYSKNTKINKKKLKSKYTTINKQYNNIIEIESQIKDLFQDENYNLIKDNIELEAITNYKEKLNKLPQKDIVEKNKSYLEIAETQIIEKKQKEIEAAWVKLNVPYISQNKNNILNGCEGAALLMALNYKGYLTNMTLPEFVTYMPISQDNNPYEGFTHDMYSLQPLTIPHWIAPPPLVNFAKSISGNENIIDSTGYSIDDLDKELDNNNPVIIYLIAKFKEPKETVEGAPRNLHVMLLTGYNKITQEHYVIDPWTHDDGRTSWTVSKELLENKYNYVGKKSVIVR